MQILAFFGFFLFVFSSQLLAANCGGTTPCNCGDTVQQHYVMTEDLGPCLGHGLTVADGVTLDGNNHKIVALLNLITENYGVYLKGTTGAIVKNVAVTGFRRGIRLSDAQGNQILNTETFQNGNFLTHVGYGIDMADGAKGNLLQGNLIYNNADEGIHFGSGSGENAFIGNTVYDNHIENIYFVASHNNTILGNVTRLGQTSVYLKDSTGNVLQENTFQDEIVHIRGDSHNNQFINNTLVNTGFHFQVYTSDTPFRHPHDNTVRGGKITNVGGTCLRFSSSWDNIVIDTVLDGCSTDIRLNSDAAQARNTVLGVGFSPSKVQLEGESALAVGWRLDTHIQDIDKNPVEAAHLRASDVAGHLLFDVTTGPEGNIPTQNVIAYIKTKTTQTLFTPISLETTKTAFRSDSRQVVLTNNTTLTITLPSVAVPINSRPIADAGADQSVLRIDVVSLDGSHSRDPDNDSLTYSWNFGDNQTASGANVSHVYDVAGVYVVTLTVSDGELTNSDTVIITVKSPPLNASPTADAGPDWVMKMGKVVVLDGSGSADPDGNVLSYSWNFDDGDTGSGVVVSHVYTAPGSYTVTLTVSDGQFSATDSALVTVEASGGSKSVIDTFDRPDSSILGNGWVEVIGDLVIGQQELENASLKGVQLAVLPELSGSTQNVAADFASLNNNPGPRFGIVLRFHDPLNYYVLYRRAGGASVLRISRIVNGEEKILASTTLPNPKKNTFFRLNGSVKGSELTLALNGVNYLVVSDSTFSDGSSGIFLSSEASTSSRVDNFAARIQ